MLPACIMSVKTKWGFWISATQMVTATEPGWCPRSPSVLRWWRPSVESGLSPLPPNYHLLKFLGGISLLASMLSVGVEWDFSTV